MSSLPGNGHESNGRGAADGVPADAARLLDVFFEPQDLVLVRPIEVWTEGTRKHSRTIYKATAHPTAADLKADPECWAPLHRAAKEDRANLFFGVCPRAGAGGLYDAAWQIRTVRALWADVDGCDFDDAYGICVARGLPRATAVVSTGHGVHLYWFLAEAYVIDDAPDLLPLHTEFVKHPDGKTTARRYVQMPDGERIYKQLLDPATGGDSKRRNPLFPSDLSPKAIHLQDVLAGMAARIGGDHTTDLARLLRLPGTWNRKNARNNKSSVMSWLTELDAGRRYALADFEPFAAHSPAKVRRQAAAKVRLPAVRRMTAPRQDHLNRLVYACDTAEDRSRADWHYVCWCIEHGVDRERAWSEVQDVGKFKERGRDYFDLTWGKAEHHTRLKLYDRDRDDGGTGRAKGTEPAPEKGPTGGQAGRPIILITTEERDVNDQAAAALTAEPTVYQRGNGLVTVFREPEETRHIRRQAGSPRIVPLATPRLRELLASVARWRKKKAAGKGKPRPVPAHPPDWSVSAVSARGSWEGIRPLEAVVEAPTLRPDGTVLDTPGWDPATTLLYEPNGEFPPLPPAPTLAMAQEAADVLLGLVEQFPFAGANHRAAWLAAALTALARFAVPGPCPLFLFEANTPGSGKSLLCDIIALIATGREMTRTAYPDSNEEMHKVITSVALAGDRLIMLDNIEGPLGGPALDAALTASSWKGRVLGRSEMTPELPLHTCWFATGNNPVLKGDAPRRVIPCRLESREERPEERGGYRIPRLKEYVTRNRPALVVAALTILRAHALAGRPQPYPLTPFGGYEEWSDAVRAAVAWTLDADPCATRGSVQVSEGGVEGLAGLLQGWAELPGGEKGVTANDALKEMNRHPDQYGRLREAMMEWSKNDDLPPPRVVGNRLRALRGRTVAGRALQALPGAGHAQRWRVITLKDHTEGRGSESEGSEESDTTASRENSKEHAEVY